jgi:hypothetical protein
MSYAYSWDTRKGTVNSVGPTNYGLGGATLCTASGPIWRTAIINWQGTGNNSNTSACIPSLPDPNPCTSTKPPNTNDICL